MRLCSRVFVSAAFILSGALAWADGIHNPSASTMGDFDGIVSGAPASGGTLDPATTAWVNQVIANGGTVSGGRQTIVNTFITCLKTNSLFSLLDRYWLLAGENTQSALTDMVGLVSATNVGATFAASVGYTASNTGPAYVNSNFVPSTNGVHYTLNSATGGGQIQNARSTAQNVIDWGGSDAGFTDILSFAALDIGGNVTSRVNSSASDNTVGTTTQGSWLASRTSSSVGEVYKNGATFFATASVSTALPTFAITIGALNQGGSFSNGSPEQFSSFYVGAGLNATQAGNFETCQNAMMTSIGINVH